MKKKLSILLALTLMVGAFCATGASATELAPSVRVNGYIVDFPDAQPFVDESNRTMIPVRFATEQLGATATWEGKTETATITKDGISVAITVGSKNLRVTENGNTGTVKMDTEAVIKDGRTYVPIRYVAEALDAYVDYSDVYKVVGIYADKLTTEQTAKLRAYDYTQSKGATSYEAAKTYKNQERLANDYGTDRNSFDGDYGYANAREHLYNCISRMATYPFEAIEKVLKGSTTDEFFDLVVQEAKAEITYVSDNIEFEFIADRSCIYQEDNVDTLTASVRGIVAMTCKINPTELSGEEMAMVGHYGFTQIPQGETVYIPVDIHMNTQAGYCVNIHTIVPLDNQYEIGG